MGGKNQVELKKKQMPKLYYIIIILANISAAIDRKKKYIYYNQSLFKERDILQ